jgi:hypothetical protein
LKYLPNSGPREATSSTVLEACLISFTALCIPARALTGSMGNIIKPFNYNKLQNKEEGLRQLL